MNAPNKSGWKPEMQVAESGFAGGPATTTGNRALMLEEPLLFEIGRARSGAPLYPIEPPELRHRPRVLPARQLHHEAQPAP
jgi:glycine dehydrogenase subunit 2